MNIIGQKVKHKVWGLGTIKNLDGNIIEVSFDEGIKKMQFPEGFEKFLVFEDSSFQDYVLKLLEEKAIKAEELRQEKLLEEEKRKQALIQNTPKPKSKRTKKIEERYNIVFKCNYCDGGSNQKRIGFCGACSDEMMNYHLSVFPHKWCTNEDSLCSQYFDGEITREELDANCEDGAFVCYESQMLREWRAFAGFALQGENKGKPLKLAHVQVNSLAVLTTRFPYAKEKDRFIFAVFLVDDAYEGDNRDEGYVTTTSKYKIELSLEEAQKLKFWMYYLNRNAPDDIAWGQGLHRYIDDIQAAQILNKIVELKTGTSDEELSKEFFEYYCRINGVDKDDIPSPEGALTRM